MLIARVGLYNIIFQVDVYQAAHVKTEVMFFLEHAPERVTDIGRFDKCRRYLVKQRRKKMIVVDVNQRNLEPLVIDRLTKLTRKSAAYHHYFCYCFFLHVICFFRFDHSCTKLRPYCKLLIAGRRLYPVNGIY